MRFVRVPEVLLDSLPMPCRRGSTGIQSVTECVMVNQERAARTKRNLIRSAAEVFEREGYAAASLTVISSQAGVSNGALHFHFASKEDLAREVEGAAADA